MTCSPRRKIRPVGLDDKDFGKEVGQVLADRPQRPTVINFRMNSVGNTLGFGCWLVSRR